MATVLYNVATFRRERGRGEGEHRRARAEGQPERDAGARSAGSDGDGDPSQPTGGDHRPRPQRRGGGARSHAGEERAPRVVGRQAGGPREGAACPRSFGLRRRRGGPALILYLDTSALVKLYVRESGTPETRARVGGATLVPTSRL